jgi:hypothetical protein
MKNDRKIIVLAILLSVALAACGGADTDSAIATGIAQTQQISALETAAAGGAAAPAEDDAPDSADNQEDAAPTETPTITQTPTPDIPQVSVSQDTNCRTGPAVYYGYRTTVNPGQVLEVVGVHAQGNDYVIVDYGAGAQCWLWLQYADKTDFSGYGLTAYNTPPTPTPTYTPTPSFDWNGTWTIYVEGDGTFSMSVTQSGNSISGSFTAAGDLISINATLSANYQVATGNWSYNGNSGPFQWQIKSGNLNQFVGSYGSGYWCGATNGASQPSPCLWP